MEIGVLRLRTLATLYFLAGAFVSGEAQSLSTGAAMHSRIHSIYDFSPSQVTAEVRAAKSKEMDSFWSEVTSQKDIALPILRTELQDRNNPAFFFSDGSALLLSLSQSQEDQKIAIEAIARTDLKDVARRSYFYQVHDLAIKGADVTPAALHILDDPKFEVFLPEHGAYRLDQPACLLEALLPLPTEMWLPAVTARIRTEGDAQANKTLLLLLFYAQTDEADRVIRSTAAESGSSKEIRDFADSILDHERKLGIASQPSKATENKLREERRKRMFAVSDEAIDDMDELTGKIARARTPAH